MFIFSYYESEYKHFMFSNKNISHGCSNNKKINHSKYDFIVNTPGTNLQPPPQVAHASHPTWTKRKTESMWPLRCKEGLALDNPSPT